MIDISHVPANARAGLMKMNADSALAHVSVQDILETAIEGVSIPKQAKALGVTHAALYKRLMAECPEDWKKVQAAQSLANLDNAEQMLEEAADGVSVGRAREFARLQCWKLERAASAHYGTSGAPVQVNINFNDVTARIRDLEAELGIAAQHTQVIDVRPQQDAA